MLKAIRENEPRAISLGYKTDQYKLLAFILSGTLAGLAGAMKVFVAQNASLTDVRWRCRAGRADDAGRRPRHRLRPGGRRLRHRRHAEYLAGFGQWVTVIQGVIFVVCVLPFRRGVVGEIAHFFRRSL